VLTIINGGFSVWCFTHLFLRIFRSPGVSPPHCYQRFSGPGSSVHPCESATLFSLVALGSPRRLGFITSSAAFDVRSGGLPWVRRTASPHLVRLRKGLSRDALRGFGLDIGTRLLMSACSTPLYHIAGSLFATYTVLSHASSPRGISANAVALLMSLFRPERRAVFSCLLVSSHQDIGLYIMPGAHSTAMPRPCGLADFTG
jgi:hypothetical protein